MKKNVYLLIYDSSSVSESLYILVCFSQTDNATCHTAEPAPTTSGSPEIRGQISPFFAQVIPGMLVVRILNCL